MVSLKLQKRLAASLLKCGQRKIWLDPNEATEISMANSRQNVRKLIKDGFVFRKPTVVHSRNRARQRKAEKDLGRHCGTGKRRGAAGARMPEKVMWMRRMRIDKHLYHELYMLAKGNRFKTKKVLMEAIHKRKAEQQAKKAADAIAESRKLRAKNQRARKMERAAIRERTESTEKSA
eukprot:GSMAST32.ASY1.ANO1.1472.1 assembled CDS